MKRFEIITEADARVLDIGETVALRKGGHVTPLAADTLKARRVTVVAEDVARSVGRRPRAGRRHPARRDWQRPQRSGAESRDRCGAARQRASPWTISAR